MNERKRSPRSADRARTEQWLLDPVDVRRHARLAKERDRARPFAKITRYAPLALAAVGAFILFWNFETLREVTVDFSAVTRLFADDGSASGGDTSGSAREPETVAVEAPAVVGAETSTARVDASPAPKPPVDALPAARQATAAPERPAVAAPERPAIAAPERPAEESARASTVVPEPEAAERVASAPSPPAEPPAPERFTFGVSINFASEGDAAAALLVLRNGGNRGVSSITWWTSPGTASAGVDYADLGTVVEKFAAGQQNRTIRIPIVGDRVVEGPETFYVHLATSEGEVVSEEGQTEVVINDDD